MTDSPAGPTASSDGPPPDAVLPAPEETSPVDQAEASNTPVSLFKFTIDGRAAPGLFVVGWILLVVAAGAGLIGLTAGPHLAGIVLFVGGAAGVLVALILLGGSQAIERRAAGAAYAGPSPILTFGAVVAGWYLAAVVVLAPLQILGIEIDGPALTLVGIVIQAVVVIGLLRVMVVGSEALTWAEMGLTRPNRAAFRDFTWGALLAAPVVVATGLLVVGLVQVLGQQPTSPLPPSGSSAGLLLNLVSGAILAPFYEELFFRGFVLTAWRRMAGPASAIVRSALLFALIHAIDQTGENFGAALAVAIVAAAGRLPVALVLGWAFDRRRSLWAAVGLHATFNAILLIVAERAFAT
ncbi:MAG: type II CAAX endopeptidase family protein [Chloroflexota bacterium]